MLLSDADAPKACIFVVVAVLLHAAQDHTADGHVAEKPVVVA